MAASSFQTRQKISQKAKQRWAEPEFRKKVVPLISESITNKWKDLDYRSKSVESLKGNTRHTGSKASFELKQHLSNVHIIHGHSKPSSRTYRSWTSMRTRCKVGGKYQTKGTTVCNRWLYSFTNFLEDMGERPEAMTLERIDNNGNYEPDNCRWATHKEQAANRTHCSTCTCLENKAGKSS